MEQKRTVKSLISKKLDRNNFFLTILLIILSLVLCIGTATILTSYAGAADNSYTYDGFSYAGLDNKTEVLYRMTFVDPSDFEKTVNEIFIEDKNLYIGPKPVVVNLLTGSKNEVASGVYAHILGGIGNEINSKNITLIAGSGNKVSQKNDNATILGGEKNIVRNGKNNGVSLISIGGKNNVADTQHDGVALIGGYTNKIGQNNVGVFILGGEKNIVKNSRENIIVGGKKVTVNTDNIFVYSNVDDDVDDGFTPKSSNAFYLNMSNGVGINTEGKAGGLSVGGAVSVGETNSSTFCTSDYLGLIVSYQGCLIGCTKAGIDNDQKRELLDKGDFCKEHYGDRFLISTENNETISKTYADAECTNNINTGYATPCFSGALGSYKNVVFESTLIDSTGSCPSEHSENKCVYKCNPGFHLAGSDGNKRCHADCAYEWKDGIIEGFYSGQQISGYSLNPVSCSSDSYTTGTPHPDTCGNHGKTLICLSGTMYVSSGSSLTGGGVATNKLYYKNCAVSEYLCNTGVYNLSYTTVTSNDTASNWNAGDRKTITGSGGQYKICLDYHVDNNKCTNNQNSEKHYQLIKCNSGYSTGSGYPNTCKKKCTLKNSSGNLQYYIHNTSITGYVSSGATCTDICTGATLKCDNGNWKKNGSITTEYQYNNCTLKGKVCSSSIYNVTGATYNQRSGTSIYEACEAYSTSGNNVCIHTGTTYRLVGCKDGYHTVGNHCEENKCEGGTKPEGTNLYKNSTRPSGNSNKSWIYTGATEPTSNLSSQLKSCEWTCKPGYVRSGNKCVKKTCKTPVPNRDYVKVGASEYVSTSISHNKSWTYTSSENPGICEWTCIEEYERDGDNNKCKRIKYDCEGDNVLFDSEAVKPINGSSPIKNEQKTLYETEAEANSNYCSFICNETNGYHYLDSGEKGKRCVKCSEGTEVRKDGKLVGCSEFMDICDENHIYDGEKCVSKGYCHDRNTPRGIVSSLPAHSLGNMLNLLPIGNLSYEIECVSNAGSITENKCQFACEPGYYCDRKDYSYVCTLPYCAGGDTIANAEYEANPDKPDVNREYVESNNGVDFHSKVSTMGNGCYYWCPEDRLYKGGYNFSHNWVCMKTAEEKKQADKNYRDTHPGQDPNIPGGGPSCLTRPHEFIGNIYYDYNPKSQNQAWRKCDTIGCAENDHGGCIQGCAASTTEIKTINGETVCLSKCDSNKYFKVEDLGGCKSCENPRQKPGEVNPLYENPINCVNKCSDGETWCEHCGDGGGDGCIITYMDPNNCEPGTHRVKNDDGTFSCVRDL